MTVGRRKRLMRRRCCSSWPADGARSITQRSSWPTPMTKSDEIIGCGSRLSQRCGTQCTSSTVVHVTDGSPRDRRDARDRGVKLLPSTHVPANANCPPCSPWQAYHGLAQSCSGSLISVQRITLLNSHVNWCRATGQSACRRMTKLPPHQMLPQKNFIGSESGEVRSTRCRELWEHLPS
jgi:hypothetical protein